MDKNTNEKQEEIKNQNCQYYNLFQYLKSYRACRWRIKYFKWAERKIWNLRRAKLIARAKIYKYYNRRFK